MQSKLRTLVITVLLGLTSLPLVVMLISLVLDTVTTTRPGSLVPDRFTLDAWQFLWSDLPGRPSIWRTLAERLSLGKVSKLSDTGSKRWIAFADQSVAHTRSLSST